MATKKPESSTGKPTKEEALNLPEVAPSNPNAWLQALQNAGYVSSVSAGTDINRLRIKGNLIYHGDEVVGEYSPRKKEPALYVQLTGMPIQFQGLFFDKPSNASDPQSNGNLAAAIGRDGTIPGAPSIEGRYCKSYFQIEAQARKFAEDGASCDTCPVHPFVPKNQLPPEAKGKRCSWRADVEFRILDKNEDGTLEANDDTIYTLSLSTTGIIEFVGTGKDPLKGSASDKSTMARLAELGFNKWGEAGILKARTLMDLGGVICGLHLIGQTSEELNRDWITPSFDPIEIIEEEEHPALETAETSGDENFADDPVPF